MNKKLHLSRRNFLFFSTSACSAVASAIGLSADVFAAESYKPAFFTATEWTFLQSAIDRLIPSNEDGPGAIELGVPVFIDKQMMEPYGDGAVWYTQGPFSPTAPPTLGYQGGLTPRQIYRQGIVTIEDWCQKNHKTNFSALDAQTQDAILSMLEKGSLSIQDPSATVFFEQLLTNVKEGYFSDPLYGGNRNMGSWSMIGFPGARADFTDWMTQPGVFYPLGPVSISMRSGELHP